MESTLMTDRFVWKQSLGEGAFGNISLVVRKTDRKEFAIKVMKDAYDDWETVRMQRELLAARLLPPHPNILRAFEVYYETERQQMTLILEYMNTGCLHGLLTDYSDQGKIMPETLILSFLRQTLLGIEHCHRLRVMHRDIKPENLLLHTDPASGNIKCKLADFSLARRVPSGKLDEHNLLRSPVTSYVSTRWYRAPEILLSDRLHSYPVDIFAIGCIMAECYELVPLFPGNSELDQLDRIISFLGAPSATRWPEGFRLAQQKFGLDFSTNASLQKGVVHEILDSVAASPARSEDAVTSITASLAVTPITLPNKQRPKPSPIQRLSGQMQTAPVSALALDLFRKLTELDPKQRLSAQEALQHDYFMEPIHSSQSDQSAWHSSISNVVPKKTKKASAMLVTSRSEQHGRSYSSLSEVEWFGS